MSHATCDKLIELPDINKAPHWLIDHAPKGQTTKLAPCVA
jgi:hypothetical protein